tara:strand:- start:61 stop:237 length:177 start_codon:yes stop_codon:yes gene_type:complete
MADVAPIVEAKETIVTAICGSKINPDSNPKNKATGNDSVVNSIYITKNIIMKRIGFCV